MKRAGVIARQIGVDRKTVIARARRDGLAMEKRPVRGGWAWFVAWPDDASPDGASDASAGEDDALMQRIIDAVLFAAPGLPAREAAMLIAAIYRRMRTCG